MLDAISVSRLHEDEDQELDAAAGASSKLSKVPDDTDSRFDPHETKQPPDAPGLAPKPVGGRFLRKRPIAVILGGLLAVAAIATFQGLQSAETDFSAAAKPHPIEPKAPTARNLEVSDVIKNAPGNSAPVLQPRLKQAPETTAASLAGEGGSVGVRPAVAPIGQPSAPVPDLSQPPPGGGRGGGESGLGMVAVTPQEEAARARREARRASLEQAMQTDVFGAGGGAEASAESSGPGRAPGGRAPPLPAGSGGPPMLPAPQEPSMPGQAETVPSGVNPDLPGQAQKNAFLGGDTQHTSAVGGYEVILQPVSPYRMRAGWVIPCALQGTVNTDLPGKVVARVTENVYDSATGSHLLIPQGATVSGPLNSSVAYGQKRAQFCWTLLERDDGVSIDLGCAPAYDRSGAAGVTGDVNNHYGKLITGVLLSAMLGAVTQTVAGDMQNYRPSVTQGFALNASNEFGSAGQQITRRNLNIQPTITAASGAEVLVLLERPVIIPPYKQPSGQGE
jgi:type IV secretory pathway VirB10-like protein